MPKKTKMYFNWSSGKDSSLALYYMLQQDLFNVDLLLTSINSHYNRVSMHGLRRALLEKQSESIGIPLSTIELPETPTMEDYGKIMEETVGALKNEGYKHCGFGDIFLEDLRAYREQQLDSFGITCHFPLWKKDTKQILDDFIKLGFKAVVVCVKSDLLDSSFVGRELDEQFLIDLPSSVDPCGENGEFHTFCYDGPIFKYPVQFEVGEKIFRTYDAPKEEIEDITQNSIGFWFCDLIPTS